MPRIRSVHPAICTDEGLAGLPASTERLFVRLWTHLDDDGRCAEHHKILKAALFPLNDDYTVEHLSADLDLLVERGQLIRYEKAGKSYLSAKPDRWLEWQKPRRKIDSKLPAPTRADIVGTPRDNDGTRAAVGVLEWSGDVEEKEGESEGEPEPVFTPVDKAVTFLYPIPQSIERITAGNPLLDKLDRVRGVHSEHFPPGLPDPSAIDLDAPASPLRPVASNPKGASDIGSVS